MTIPTSSPNINRQGSQSTRCTGSFPNEMTQGLSQHEVVPCINWLVSPQISWGTQRLSSKRFPKNPVYPSALFHSNPLKAVTTSSHDQMETSSSEHHAKEEKGAPPYGQGMKGDRCTHSCRDKQTETTGLPTFLDVTSNSLQSGVRGYHPGTTAG